jgi:SAM-dependent methyltransferase
VTNDEQIYPFGYGPAATGIMESRSAESNASFLLSHLRPGMAVLDVGCGPGSITVGIAEAVSPGDVLGIDIEASHIAIGNQRAASLGLKNCRFETASIFDLPLSDNSVDAVYGHAILMQFSDLNAVWIEIKRVLKPSGLIGFREIDFGASLYHSDTSPFRQLQQVLRRSIAHNGGNPDIGRRLPSILTGAGFEILTTGAVYNVTPTPDAMAKRNAAMARLWRESEFPEQAETLGWISSEQRATMVERLEAEAKDRGSFAASTYVEVVARLT